MRWPNTPTRSTLVGVMKKARGISPRALRIVASHSALAGLCPLIPLPYVDDVLIRRITRHMYRDLFAAHDLTVTPADEKALLATPSRWLRSAATSVALFPVRKLVRKLVYVLAIKDCGDVASSVFHDGWLLAHLLEHPPQHDTLTDTAYLKKVRKAMLQTYTDIDPAPLRRALTGAYRAAKIGAEEAARRIKGGKPETNDVLTRKLRAAVNSQWPYLDSLAQQFRQNLGLPVARVHAAESAESAESAGL